MRRGNEVKSEVVEVHQDVRGARYDGWHNVWLLLSETSHTALSA